MIGENIKAGFAQVLENKRLVFVFYLMSFIFGVVLLAPVRSVVTSFGGHTLMGGQLAGNIDLNFILELFRDRKGFFSAYRPLLIMVPVFYSLAALFLSGGALSVFRRAAAATPRDFWMGCVTHFGRFLRLFFLSVPVFALLFCLQFLETGFVRAFFGKDPYENILFWGSWVRLALRLLGLIIGWMIFDYARIHAVQSGETKMRRSLLHALRLVFGNPGRTLGLALAIFVAGMIVLAVYNPVANALSAPNALVVAALFLCQQVYIMVRMFLRLALWSGETHMFDRLRANSVQERPAPDVGLEGVAV